MQVGGAKGLAVTGATGCDIHDPAGADPHLGQKMFLLVRFLAVVCS
jgi:hypothetical protein